MYGLVNKAIKDMVCHHFGEPAWEQLKRKAGIDVEEFIRMDAYDDALTYDLVAAASELFNLSQDAVFEAFGEYWMTFTAKEGYKDLIEATGSNVAEFLLNLDNLHDRIGLIYPALKPPQFNCWQASANRVIVEYYSARRGLAPMMVGLLKGVGKFYQTPVVVCQTAFKGQGSDKDIFCVDIQV